MDGDFHQSHIRTQNLTNFTIKNDPWSKWSALNVTSFVIFIIIITIALCGNILVVYVFAVNRKLRQSAPTYFIISLAISDLFTASVVMPFDLEQLLTHYTWKHGALMCSVWTTLYMLMVPTSILNLLVMTIDRYKTLSDPLNRFKESPFMTKKKALLIITVLWTYCLLFALLPVMGWKIYNDVIINGSCVFNISPIYSMLSSVVNFIIPLMTMCYLYLQIYRIASGFTKISVKKMTRPPVSSPRPKQNSAPNGMMSSVIIRDQKILLRNTRAAKTVLVIVCTFVLCWMPYTIFSFVTAACLSCFYAEGSEIILSVLLIMGYANSAINPFLFGLKSRLLKKTFKMLFRNRFQCIRLQHRNKLPHNLQYRVTRTGSLHMVQGGTNEDEPVAGFKGKNNFAASLVSIQGI